MSRYRRRKKKPLWKTLPLWAAGLSLVGWGLYQAAAFREKLAADYARSQALAMEDSITTRPSLAVEGVTVVRRVGSVLPRTTTEARAARDPTKNDTDATIEILDPLTDPDPPRLTPRLLPGIPAPLFEATLTPADLAARAAAAFDANRIPDARAALNAALARTTDDAEAQGLREALTGLNLPVFFGGDVLPEDPLACYIDIEPGDSFLRLGREFGTPAAYLEMINPSLNPRNLKPLTGIKIVPGPFRAQILKQAARMDLYLGDLFIRSYPLALPEGNFLPAGTYRLSQGTKLQVANRFWIGFEGAETATASVEAGWIYGTWGPRGTGTRNRATGLIMADADLAQLYNVLVESRSNLLVLP
jgi:hypothetical protein